MKKSYLIAAAILSALVSLPAVAGPDWQVIHEAEDYASKTHTIRNLAAHEQTLTPNSRASSTFGAQKKEAAIKLSTQSSTLHG